VKSPRRLILPVLTVAVLGVAAPAFAVDGGGGTSTISAALTAATVGSRSVTSVSPVVLTNVLNTSTATGALAVTVTEAARTGTNAWSLTATASALSDGASPTPSTIAASNLSVLSRSVVQVGSGGIASAPAGTSSLASAATLFTTTGQDPALLYTGTYAAAGTISLTVPNGAPTGAYTGTLTVSLI
jgi:hypothetical protein